MATINQILVDLENVTEEGAKDLVLDIHKRLAETTPVDTGWAANNWIPSIGTPVTSVAGSPLNQDTTPVIKGIADVLKWKFSLGAAFISNNVPYITFLNGGSSVQAPAMFVESAVNVATAKANRTKLK